MAFLPYLRVFEAVARLGTLKAAAEELHLSPSAISLQLRKLSECTGIQLFEKAGRNVELTLAGRDFSQSVSHNLRQLSAAARAAKKSGEDGRTVSLGVSLPTALGTAWATRAVVEFAETKGIANLIINEAIMHDQVAWENNDVAIVYDNPPFKGRAWQLLSEVKLQPVCSPTLFPRLDLHHRDRAVSGIPLLHEDSGDEWAKWAAAARVSLQGSLRVKVPSVAHTVASAVQGKGIALVSDVLTRDHLGHGQLIQPFPTAINASRAYYLVWAVDRADDQLLQSLVARLLDLIKVERTR
ncbi:LysR family transcriptional regulator [Mesorhizobium sp. BAC0120]|uniref:LysR family transcriptional regulator n=1 Tax=Mesorhizobium sp. BAC0120 TaxID=3090670 RepID=UPI00298C834B|nr:LysR family transcriptional regulator [Mesorhizobium sp. BAC0120]MDW6023241.1 LysR family transcriptional regulator [Mesorhizobium sp. BAC0120]